MNTASGNRRWYKVERGEAERVDRLWWVYMTTQAAAGQAKVIGVAEDLAGHIGQGVSNR